MQHSLCLVIAPVRTLITGTAVGHAWLIHPQDGAVVRAPSGDDDHDPALTFPCTGVHYSDGSMADDVTLNWIVTGINTIAQARRHPIPLTDEQVAFAAEVYQLTRGITDVDAVVKALDEGRTADGTPYAEVRLPDLPGVPRDIFGRPYPFPQVQVNQQAKRTQLDSPGLILRTLEERGGLRGSFEAGPAAGAYG